MKSLKFFTGSLIWNILMCFFIEISTGAHVIVIKAFFLFGLLLAYHLWTIHQPLPQHQRIK